MYLLKQRIKTMEYVSDEYAQQLQELAKLLVRPDRYEEIGQLALFEQVETPENITVGED